MELCDRAETAVTKNFPHSGEEIENVRGNHLFYAGSENEVSSLSEIRKIRDDLIRKEIFAGDNPLAARLEEIRKHPDATLRMIKFAEWARDAIDNAEVRAILLETKKKEARIHDRIRSSIG